MTDINGIFAFSLRPLHQLFENVDRSKENGRNMRGHMVDYPSHSYTLLDIFCLSRTHSRLWTEK